MRAVVVTTYAPTATYWTKLIGASIGNRPEGCLRLKGVASLLTAAGTFAPRELAILACDFSLLARTPDMPLAALASAGACPGQFAARPRQHLGSAEDSQASRDLREALARLSDV